MTLRVLGLGAVVLVVAPVVCVTVHRPPNRGNEAAPGPTTVSEDDRRAIEEGEKLRRAARNPPKPAAKAKDPFPPAGGKGAATRH